MPRISMTGCFNHSMTIVGWFAALVITVNPGVGISVVTWKYVCACGPMTVELRMDGLNEVNRKETNIGRGFCVGYGSAPKMEGCGTVLLPEAALGFALFGHPP
jgi:hypothetical protein